MASCTVARLTGTTATVLVTAAMAAIPLAGVASAAPSEDRDCRDFPTQIAAQTVLAADPSDPNRLDRNNNGVACENDDYVSAGQSPDDRASDDRASGVPAPDDRTAGGQVGTTPVGSVDAGDGSAAAAAGAPAGQADDPMIFILGGFGALAASGAAAAVWSTRRSGSSSRR